MKTTERLAPEAIPNEDGTMLEKSRWLTRRAVTVCTLLAVCWSLAAGVARGDDVQSLTSWTTGLTGPDRNTSGSNRLLIFTAGMEAGSDLTITSASFGGQALSQVITVSAGSSTYARAYIFYLDEAGLQAATSNTLSVNWSGSTSNVSYAARIYGNVDQGSPIRESQQNSSSSSTPNPITTPSMTVESGDYVIAAAQCGNNELYSWNNGFAEGTDQQAGSSDHSTADLAISSSGSVVASAQNNSPNRQVILGAVLTHASAAPTAAALITVSTTGSATLKGQFISDEDLGQYDPDTDTAIKLLDGGSVITDQSSNGHDIDAVYLRADGKIVLSTTEDSSIDGVSFGDDDLVEYDPETGSATIIFNGGNLFSNSNEDIKAVHILDNGNMVLSTSGSATLGGLSFGDDDLVEYDPNTDTATLFFDGSTIFSNTDEDIDAVCVMENGHILLSTTGSAQIGSLSFNDEDVVEYDPGSGTATVYFDGSTMYSDDEDTDAVHIDTATKDGYWKLDETAGTSAADSSVNNRAGLLGGGLSFTSDSVADCQFAAALELDGINDQIVVTGHKGVLGAGARTVAVWIKTDTTGAIISWGDTGAGEQWSFRVQDDHGQAGAIGVDVGTGYIVGSTDVRDGHWHHVAAVLPDALDNASDILLYVDGVLETTSDVNMQTIDTASDEDVTIGNDHSNRYFKGVIAEVRIVDGELTHAEISALYGLVGYWKHDESSPATVAVDSSGNGHDATLNGSPNWDTGEIDGGLTFDGGSDYNSVASTALLEITSSLSISAWIKGDSWGSGSNVDVIVRKGEGNPNNYQLAIADGQVSLFLDGNDDGGFRGDTVLATGTWYHVAATWDGSEVRVYLNGVMDHASPYSQSSTIATDTRTLYIGGRSGTDQFDGTIDDVRLFNRALCPDEIAAFQTSGVPNGVRIIKWLEVQ